MLKLIDAFIAPINKLLSSTGLLSLIKASPLLLVPILAYILGAKYLDSQIEKEREQQLLRKIELALDSHQDNYGRAIAYFMLREKPEGDRFNIFIRVLDCIKIHQVNGKNWGSQLSDESYKFLNNLKNFYGNGTTQALAKEYFIEKSTIFRPELLELLLTESDKHEKGEDILVEFLIDSAFMNGLRESDNFFGNKMLSLIRLYTDTHNIKKKKRKQILGED